MQALVTQLRVIAALILREARTRFGKAQLGYLWSLVSPVAIIVTFTLTSSLVMMKVPPIGNSLPLFFATGALAFQCWRNVSTYCSAALDANRALLQYPIVQQIDTLIARALLEVATTVFAMAAIFGALVLFLNADKPARVEVIAEAVVLLSLLGFGNGVLNAVISTYAPSWRNIEALLMRPMFFLSGVFFVPDRMPSLLKSFLAWNPVLHGIELMRCGYYRSYTSYILDVRYLTFWALALVVAGLAAERATRIRSAQAMSFGAESA